MLLFLRGLAIGLSIAAPVGPIGVLCIRRTLADGRLAGLITGLGAATADACDGAAGFGLTVISTVFLRQSLWIRLLGGLFLCYLGIRAAIAAPATHAVSAAGRTLWQSYLSALALTITNPLTILSFAAVFAGVGVGATGGAAGAVLLVSGVLVGSALWWLILSSTVGLLRTRITARALRWVNRCSGTALVAFGLLALASLR
ncbi:MAG TPA: LysE family transporter [Thermomicrobiales bacterium]|nr:LysE family transporter [Thermomicrobiales bacterium]